MSSSSEEDLDAFFASLRPKKEKEKFRLSSGSLEEFVVGDDHISFNEDDNSCSKKYSAESSSAEDCHISSEIGSKCIEEPIKNKTKRKKRKSHTSTALKGLENDFSMLEITQNDGSESSASEEDNCEVVVKEDSNKKIPNELSNDNSFKEDRTGYGNTKNKYHENDLISSDVDTIEVHLEPDESSPSESRNTSGLRLALSGSEDLDVSDKENDKPKENHKSKVSIDFSSDSDASSEDENKELKTKRRGKLESVNEKFFEEPAPVRKNLSGKNVTTQTKHLDSIRRRGSFTPKQSSTAKSFTKKSITTPRIVFSSDESNDEESDIFKTTNVKKSLILPKDKDSSVLEPTPLKSLNIIDKSKVKSLKKSPRVLLPDEDFSSTFLDETESPSSDMKTRRKRDHKKSSRVFVLADNKAPSYMLNLDVSSLKTKSKTEKIDVSILYTEGSIYTPLHMPSESLISENKVSRNLKTETNLSSSYDRTAENTNQKSKVDKKESPETLNESHETSSFVPTSVPQSPNSTLSSKKKQSKTLLLFSDDDEIISSAPNTPPLNQFVKKSPKHIISSAKKLSKVLVISSDDSDDPELDNDVIFIDDEASEKENLENNVFESPSPSSIQSNSIFGSSGLTSKIGTSKSNPGIRDEDDDSYIPLVARINGGKLPVLQNVQNHDLNPPRRKISEPKPERKVYTPLQKPPKSCFTEKPIKSRPVTKRSDGIPPNLPPNCDKGAGFKRQREVITKILYRFFNKTVFMERLPEDMIVEWDKRLTKTAGVTKCSSRTVTTVENGIRCVNKTYKATISLSEKVLDTLHRLRDTLCHEMCHAAVWVLDNQNDGHGPFWKAWARKATAAHPEMPVVKRCHSYDITYKFQYQCTTCRKIYGRHSKSIKVDKQACGVCRGRLVLLPPIKSDGTPAKSRQPNKFAMFVKEHYKTVQRSNSVGGITPKHSDVMRALSEKFASMSAKN